MDGQCSMIVYRLCKMTVYSFVIIIQTVTKPDEL